MNQKLDAKIDKIIEANIEHVPYEGADVNQTRMSDQLYKLVTDLLKGYGTWVKRNYTHTAKGWKHNGLLVIHDRDTMVDQFLNQNL